MKKTIMDFLKSKAVRTFLWQTANGAIVLIIGLVATIQPEIVDVKLAFLASASLSLLNIATKAINKKYL